MMGATMLALWCWRHLTHSRLQQRQRRRREINGFLCIGASSWKTFFLSLNAIKMSFRVYMKKKILQQEKFALRYSEYLVAVLKLLAGKYFEDTQLDEMMKNISNILIDSLLKTAKINSKIFPSWIFIHDSMLHVATGHKNFIKMRSETARISLSRY